MAEKVVLPPKKRLRFRLTSNASAGSSAGGGGRGGDGDSAAAPAPAPRREPSSLPPRSPSLPKPLTYKHGAGSRGDGGGGGDGAAAPTPAPRRVPSSTPPRSTSPRKPFTYNPSAGSSGGGGAAGPKLSYSEPLSHLVCGAAGKPIPQYKFKILSEYYACFRPMRRDGSQFYRAFLFSYLENLGKMQGSQAEVTRLMECVARSRVNFLRLEWNDAYFSNPEAFFSSVVSPAMHKTIVQDFFFLTKNHAGHLLVAKILIVPHGLNHRDYVVCIFSRNSRSLSTWSILLQMG
ncbi:hypothetical protein BDA96_08G033200 [Sorghum bicolor]|uniref:Ubiquitinyl hydrolase 1 n=1 Tax=Sorghum bicolor TaxID=4558 RepID=A0A921QCX1_SORBI|nr:hypothetical protein BDA96_08G033200 [Sorghum bicolor]